MNPFYYALFIYSIFWLINYSSGISVIFKQLTENCPDKVKYAFSCIFCLTFWLSLIIVPIAGFPWWLIFVAPSINLFLHSIYSSINQ